METRANYTLTGLFVVLFAAAAVLLGLWIAGELRQGDTQPYLVYLDEPVSGLNENSTVLLQGVPVGKVRALSLDPDHPSRVRIVLDLDEQAPVRADTVAILRTQGATGLMRLELEGGSHEAGPPEQPEGEPYPVIQSRPSFWTRVDDSVDEGLQTFNKLAQQLDRLLDDETVDGLTESLANLRTFSESLARNSDELDRLMGSAGDLADSLPATLARVDRAVKSFDDMSRGLEQTGRDLSEAAAIGGEGLERFSGQTLPELEALMLELGILSARLQRLSGELSEQPEMLIFGRPVREPGPGED
ncbi:MlaD family protein [Natronospira bacteriovora]|uniref:MlaD family protein n=1 Tax=Natronospira bacteriovora TaxID=3069753 RepID=A0ABU0W8F7_9GAMM|nr:MlaD family protein [Natronospira sp. AB-CW4]MDQ2070033.1 MlaD family protein [Natronospira sp. AB-CW4]